MIKRLLIFLVLLVVPVSAWGTTYYLSPTGSDISNGTTSGTPWASTERVDIQSISTGDSIIITGTTSITPLRGDFTTVDSGITYEGDGTQYISAGYNVSNGEAHILRDYKYYMESWVDAVNLSSWSEGGTVARNDTDQNNGTYCAKLTGVNSYISRDFLVPKGDFRIHVIYKTDADSVLKWRIKHVANNVYLAADYDWDAGSGDWIGSYTNTGWSEMVIGWASNDTTGSNIRFILTSQTAEKSVYIDGVWIEHKCDWEVHAGDVYKAAWVIASDPQSFHKTTAWDASGFENMEKCNHAVSLETIAAGEWFYDGTTDLLYYYLASGETINNLHFEVANGIKTFYISHDSTIVSDICALSGYSGFDVNGTATGVQLNNVRGAYSVFAGLLVANTASVTVNNSEFDHSSSNIAGNVHGEGFISQNTATTVLNRCYFHDSDDDQINPSMSSTTTIKFSKAVCNSVGATAMPMEVSLDTGTGGAITAYNNVFVQNNVLSDQPVIQDKGTVNTVSIYQNNITYQRGTAEYNVLINTPDRSGGSGSVTASNNCLWGTSIKATSSYYTILADPLFLDVAGGDFRLKRNSPCRDAGTDVSLTTDYAGNPVPRNRTPDIGAYEYQDAPNKIKLGTGLRP